MSKSNDRQSKMGAAITVRLSPRGKQAAITGILDDGTLTVQLTHLPESDEVNQELLTYLAKILDLPVTALETVAGQKGRDKLVAITGLPADIVQEKMLKSAGLTQAELDRRRQNSSAHRHEP
jgi:uncharacterized protein YggU (UPF0235/DUF167 family)